MDPPPDVGLPIEEDHQNPDPSMVLAEFLSINQDTDEAIFVCKAPQFALVTLSLGHLTRIPNLRVDHLRPGFKIRCRVVDKVVQVFRIAHFPLEAVDKILVQNATVVMIDEVSKVKIQLPNFFNVF